MKLLIVTQAVDQDDPILGFFCRWVEEFAKHCEKVTVICLREGKHALPKNVSVYSLGKDGKERESNATTTMIYHSGLRMRYSSVRYSVKFLSLVWRLHRDYNAVFVHMNPEYVVLGGLLWRLWSKRIGLWYVHKSVTFPLRLATLLTHVVFTASPESFRLSSKKVRVVGHGIDTDFLKPDPSIRRGDHWLSVGRLMPSKRHDRAIRLAHGKGVPLRIAGAGPERERLETLARELGADVVFLGSCKQETLRDEYRRAVRLVHRSETGSLDKVVLEAAACGCAVDSTDLAISKLPLSQEYVRTHHSLQSLIPRITEAYDAV